MEFNEEMATTSTDRRNGVNVGAAVKVPCVAATTANITLSGEQTIDGVTCVTGDRVLVKNQTDGSENGIYEVDTSSWQRTKDWDGDKEVKKGTIVFVTDGFVNTGFWFVVTSNPITVGSTSISILRLSTVLAVVSSFFQTLLDDDSADVFVTNLVSTMTLATSPDKDDEIILDPAIGSGRRMSLENMFKVINDLTADATPDPAADYLVTYDDSAGSSKKILLNKIREVLQLGNVSIAKRAAAQSVASGIGGAAVVFDTEVQTDSGYTYSTSGITIVNDGVYTISVEGQFASASAAQFGVSAERVSGTGYTGRLPVWSGGLAAVTSGVQSLSASLTAYLPAGLVIGMRATQTTGGNVDFLGSMSIVRNR